MLGGEEIMTGNNLVYIKKDELIRNLSSKNLTQKEFAKSIGVSTSWVSQIKHGKPVGPEARVKVMRFLRVNDEAFDSLFEIK